jgi:hypothetical protein
MTKSNLSTLRGIAHGKGYAIEYHIYNPKRTAAIYAWRKVKGKTLFVVDMSHYSNGLIEIEKILTEIAS